MTLPVRPSGAIPTGAGDPSLDPADGGQHVNVSGGTLDSSARYTYFTLAMIQGSRQVLTTIGGAASRRIAVVGIGTLVTTPLNPLPGRATESMPVSDNIEEIRAVALETTTSGITGVKVYW